MDSKHIAKALADAFYYKMSIKNDDDFKKPAIHKAIDECMEQIGLERGKINIIKKTKLPKIEEIDEIYSNNKKLYIEDHKRNQITIYDNDMDFEMNGRQVKRKKCG